ncbi:hypothetical protein [Paraburkholderia fungorum]|uniref:hypothetical protein n=1 Tax=Paraburkholderia fungorum TaxID=134537 RepID=UPI0038BB5819
MSLPALAFLKLVAWHDRRARGNKDAFDLLLILPNYLEAGRRSGSGRSLVTSSRPTSSTLISRRARFSAAKHARLHCQEHGTPSSHSSRTSKREVDLLASCAERTMRRRITHPTPR